MIILFILWRVVGIIGLPERYANYLMSYGDLGGKLLLVAAAILLFHQPLTESFNRIRVLKLIKTVIITPIAIILTVGLINLLLFTPIDAFYFYFPFYQRNAPMVFHILLVAPFLEEVFYRYTLIYRGKKRWLRRITTIGSLLLFTWAHIGNANGAIFALFPFFFIGLYLTIAYLREKNIWASIFAHMVYNLMVMVLALLQST